jgi:chemotaxis signal transduction protein
MSEFSNGGDRPGEVLWCRLQVDDRRYCFRADQVLEVVPFPPITSLPHAPRLLIGIAGLRSAALPIVDARLAGEAGVPSTCPSPNGSGATFKYVAIVRVAVSGEEALLGVAAHAVSHTSEIENDAAAEILELGALAEALRGAAAARSRA